MTHTHETDDGVCPTCYGMGWLEYRGKLLGACAVLATSHTAAAVRTLVRTVDETEMSAE